MPFKLLSWAPLSAKAPWYDQGDVQKWGVVGDMGEVGDIDIPHETSSGDSRRQPKKFRSSSAEECSSFRWI